MPQRLRRRLVLVVSAPGGAADTVLATLGDMGVPTIPPGPSSRLGAVSAAGDRAADTTRSVLRDLADAAATPHAGDHGDLADAAWAHPSLCTTVGAWCDAAADTGWEPVVVLAWEQPEACAAVAAVSGADARAAEALAAWEVGNRAALAGLAGRACTVVATDAAGTTTSPGAAALLAKALGVDVLPPSGAGRRPARRADGAPGPDDVLSAQRALARVLAGLVGTHEVLPAPTLPPMSSWAAALQRAEERTRRAAGETAEAWAQAWAKTEDADTLWRALWRVGDELAEAVSADLPVGHVPFYGGDATVDLHGYLRWIAEREARPGAPGSAAVTDPSLGAGPLISVVVPVYKPEPALLESAVSSVLRQTYDRWELCLCDDGSGDPTVTAALEATAARDPRVKVTALAANGGISAATNGALEVATGEWVAFMDQDDELAPDALAAVAGAVMADPSVDLVYTDDDKIDREGRRFGPQFKPDWDPDLLLSMCYFSHLVAMRRALVDEVGGLRSAYDGGQDWDLALRVSERARTVRHVPRVLYHWRAVPGSAALDASYKPWAYEAARRAVADALARRGEPGTVEHHPRFRGLYHVRRDLTGEPLVSIVVPFRDGAGLLQRCVDSLTVDPGYGRFELLLVDNGSTEPEMAALLDRLSADDRVTVVRDPRPFNWAALNNAAINRSRGDMVLTLNNDVTAASPGWLREMVVHAQRPDIGAVGARLLYPDGRVQHVGAVVGLGGIVAHPMRGLPGDHPGYMGFATVIRGWSAVTGACLLTRRSVVEEVGGFDEKLAVAFNDVDFCLRVLGRGYRIVSTPLAELVHAESSTRGFTGYARDIVPFITRWEHWLRGEDPMFSPNLSRFDARCVVRLADEDDQWNRQLEKLGLS